MSALNSNCAGVARRDFIQVGLRGLLGLGLADMLRLRAQGAENHDLLAGAGQVNCILIWLDGGPSHYETFDPKPDAPSEVRSLLGTVKTAIPGVHFCETAPRLAKVADKLTVLRSICHGDPNHGGGNHYMMTGAPTPVPVGCGAFVSFHPSYGSVVSYERGVRNGLPAYMTLPNISRSGGPNFLGARHAPFVIGGNPNGDGFKVRDVVLPNGISEGRAATRRELRLTLDRMRRIGDLAAEDPTIGFDGFYKQGVELICSSKAQAAFDLGQEPAQVRERYGRTDLGQRLLLCRRLVEVGVSFVTCYYGGWDHHTDIFDSLKNRHMPKLDQGLAALISDLDDRGMLDKTLVLVLGEFGRTPKVNERGGRDHWPHAMSILMAGAGTPRGAVLGATDAKGYYASEDIHSPEDFAATLYTKMGIDPATVLHNSSGRPVPLVNGGKRIKQLFA